MATKPRRRVSFDDRTPIEFEECAICDDHVNFGLVTKGRQYVVHTGVTFGPIKLSALDTMLSPRHADAPTPPDLPEIQPIEQSQVTAHWYSPGVIELLVTPAVDGEFVEKFDVNGEQLLVKGRTMDRSHGTPSLRRGVRRLGHAEHNDHLLAPPPIEE